MGGRADRGGIDQGSHGDVGPFAVADPGIKQRAAAGAVRVMGGVVAVDDPLVLAPDEAEPDVFDAGERLEGGTRGPAAVRAVTIQRVRERIRHLVADRAAVAFAGKDTSV